MNTTRKYEVLLIVDTTLDKPSQDALIKSTESKIGGKLVKKEEWGIKEFAYPIKKRSEGNYTLFYVETEPEAIAELKEFFRITKGILRTLIIKHEVKFPFEMKTASQLVFPERKPRRVVNRGPRVPHAAEQTSETSTEDKKEAPAKEAAPAKTESKEESNVE